MKRNIALVFGGSRGIGAACVEVLARDDFDVAYTYVTTAPDSRPAEGGAQVTAYQAEISDAAAVTRVFDAVEADFGAAPDCVILSSGINMPPKPVSEVAPEDFGALVAVNLVGAFNVLREAGRRVRDDGSIVAITTSFVRHAPAGFGPYCATKAAVESLVRAMSKELASRRVRVNAVAPGPIDTELFRAGKTAEAVSRSAAMSPFNRVGQPTEVAEVVGFLASGKASWIHGQIVQPNGGLI